MLVILEDLFERLDVHIQVLGDIFVGGVGSSGDFYWLSNEDGDGAGFGRPERDAPETGEVYWHETYLSSYPTYCLTLEGVAVEDPMQAKGEAWNNIGAIE